jgi:hypothetical protein
LALNQSAHTGVALFSYNIYIYFAGDSIDIASDIHTRWRSHFVAQLPLRRFRQYHRRTLGILSPQSRVFSFTAEVA